MAAIITGTIMQNSVNTTHDPKATILGRIATEPTRLMTVREWWKEADEPIELLADPAATFEAEECKLLSLCAANSIAYRAASNGKSAAFPAWLFLVAIPANP